MGPQELELVRSHPRSWATPRLPSRATAGPGQAHQGHLRGSIQPCLPCPFDPKNPKPPFQQAWRSRKATSSLVCGTQEGYGGLTATQYGRKECVFGDTGLGNLFMSSAWHWKKQSRNMPAYPSTLEKPLLMCQLVHVSTLLASTLGGMWISWGFSNGTTMSPDQGLSICQGFPTCQHTQTSVEEATGV